MKINLRSITHIFHFKRHDAYTRNAYHDWQRIAYTTAMLLLVILAGAVFLFWEIDHDALFRPKLSSESLVPTVDRTSITSVSSYYSDKATALENLTASSTAVVDPSL